MSTPTVVTKNDLIRQLRDLGVEAGGVLVVHASFRAIGPVEDGPAGLMAALREVIGPKGNLVMPTMTGSRRTEPYDPSSTATRNMGIVAETFWRLPGTRRGDHPTSSFAAAGPLAEQITAPQPIEPAIGPSSPIGRAHDLDASILLLGVGQDSNTTIHLAERLAEVPYRIRKWTTVLRDGIPTRVEFDAIDHCCQNFALLDGWLRERELLREGKVGHADARLMRSRDLVETVVPRLVEHPLLFLCRPDAGCEECDAARASIDSTTNGSTCPC